MAQLDYSGLQYGVKSIGDAVQKGQKSQLEFMLNMKKQEQQARKNNMDVFKMWMDSEGKAIGNLLQKGKVEEANQKFEMAKQNSNLTSVFTGLGIDMLSFEQKGKDVAIVTVSPMTEELQKKLNSNIPLGTNVKTKGVKDAKGNIDIYEAVPFAEKGRMTDAQVLKVAQGFMEEDPNLTLEKAIEKTQKIFRTNENQKTMPQNDATISRIDSLLESSPTLQSFSGNPDSKMNLIDSETLSLNNTLSDLPSKSKQNIENRIDEIEREMQRSPGQQNQLRMQLMELRDQYLNLSNTTNNSQSTTTGVSYSIED